MAIRINKKLTIILIIIAVLIIGGAGGYLLWRINQDDTVAPTDSDAASVEYNTFAECQSVANSRNVYHKVCLPWANDENKLVYPSSKVCYGFFIGCDSDYTVQCLECSAPSTPTTPVCGNGTCESGETVTSCAKDCATTCATFTTEDGCTTEKTALSCDWYTCNGDSWCGNADLTGYCDTCGNGTCSDDEDSESCPEDCEEAEIVADGANITVSRGAVEECVGSGTDSPVSYVTYTILIKNTGDESGTITKVVDDLDSKVLSSYIEDISGVGEYSSGQVVWDFTGSTRDIAAGAEKTFTYVTAIPRAAFGTYSGTTTVSVVDEASVTGSRSLAVDCDASGDVPQTGLFDSTVSRIAGGLILVVIGLVFTRMTDMFGRGVSLLNNSVKKAMVSVEENRDEKRKNKFEKKITRKW